MIYDRIGKHRVGYDRIRWDSLVPDSALHIVSEYTVSDLSMA